MTDSSVRKGGFSGKQLAIGGCSILFSGCLILTLWIFVRPLFVSIGPDEIGVVISAFSPDGINPTALMPGNQLLSFGERAEIFKTSKVVYSSTSTDCNCGSSASRAVVFKTKDGVKTSIHYQLSYAINPDEVINLFREWYHTYPTEFVIPVSKRVVMEAASQYTSSDMALMKRSEIEQAVFSRLEPTFSENHLVLFEFKIDEIQLDK